MLLGMLGLAFLWVSQVPFTIFEVWWRSRYDVAEWLLRVDLRGWLFLGSPRS